MKQNIIRKTCQVVPVLLITGALAACDAHIEESEETKYPVHVLCVDGTVIPYSEYEQSKEQAIAVVFHIGSDGAGPKVLHNKFALLMAISRNERFPVAR